MFVVYELWTPLRLKAKHIISLHFRKNISVIHYTTLFDPINKQHVDSQFNS